MLKKIRETRKDEVINMFIFFNENVNVKKID